LASYSFELPKNEFRGRAVAGIAKVGLSQGLRLFVQVGSMILLSRLLLPSDFGILAMVGPIIAFASLFQDLGLTQAVVQRSSMTQGEASALFVVSLSMSVGLAALLLAISPLVSWFYGEPRTGALTAAMGVNLVLGGAVSLHYALLNRRMQFGALAVIDAVSAVGGLAVSLAFALLYHNFWALYAGNVGAALILTAGCWIATGWCPSLPRFDSRVGASLHFGANVTGFNIANYFARNLDNVLIGWRWGEQALGIYDRAYKLLLMPLQQINSPIFKVMLPVLTQMNGEPERYRQTFLRVLAQILLITLPGIAFMVGTADLVIPILLGRQWSGASPIFAVLGMASFLQVLNNPTGWLFLSQNRTREFLCWGIFGSATSVISFLAGLSCGPLGVAMAYAASEYIRTPILWWYVTRRGPIRARDVVRTALPHLSGAIASLGAVCGVRALLPEAPFLVLGVSLGVSCLVTVLVLAAFTCGRETIGETVRLVCSPFRRLCAAS
jgi:PST family polysaccharide transporter